MKQPMETTLCFVFGCERSGTTALVDLLNSHPAVAMGTERYYNILREMRTNRNSQLLTPEHFTPARFFDFRPTDSNHSPANLVRHHEHLRPRFDSGSIRVMGDKILPPDQWLMWTLARNFPTAKFVFIYRDLLRVANSFEVRSRNKDDRRWPAENGWRYAHQHWLEAFRAANSVAFRVGQENLFVVRYERLFSGCSLTCSRLFGFLGLSVEPAVTGKLVNLCAGWPERQAKPLVLAADQQEWLKLQMDETTVNRFDAHFAEQLAGQSLWRLGRRLLRSQPWQSTQRSSDATLDRSKSKNEAMPDGASRARPHGGQGAGLTGKSPARAATRFTETTLCFIFGCERSGTTALVHLLNLHSAVAMGTERYYKILREMRTTRNPKLLMPEHFTPARFFDFRPTDSNHSPASLMRRHDHLRPRFDDGSIRIIGDKIQPPDEWLMKTLASNFPAAKFVFVYRDLVRVANSFEVRARTHPRWPAENGWRYGHQHWLEAFRTADSLAADVGREKLFLIRYERLFSGCELTCSRLFGFLDLSVEPGLATEMKTLGANWEKRQAQPLMLGADEQAWLNLRMEPTTLRRFDDWFEHQLD